MVRIPGICNNERETTVLAHLNGAGMGLKHDDLFGAFACSACHDALDGRRMDANLHYQSLREMHLDGMMRTIDWWVENGFISHK